MEVVAREAVREGEAVRARRWQGQRAQAAAALDHARLRAMRTLRLSRLKACPCRPISLDWPVLMFSK